MMTGRVVIVGASLAGLRCARELRAHGHAGEIILIGDEPHLPYDRPPLSKEFLLGTRTVADLRLAGADSVSATIRTGVAALSLNRQARTVALSDGTSVSYDALVIATGAAARDWPEPTPAEVLRFRGLGDAAALRALLGRPGARLLVVGAGFLGGEIAASAARLGVPTTLVEAQARPLAAVLGAEAGDFLAHLHRRAGITLRTGTSVRTFHGHDRLTAVTLTDDTTVPADVAVLALGATPRTGWLTGSGLAIGVGLACDQAGRVFTDDGDVDPAITAAGDVASWPHPLAGGSVLLGHWTNATHHATTIARTLLGLHPLPAPVPSFWSDLHDSKLRSIGLPQLADGIRVLENDVENRRFEAVYLRQGDLVGAVTINRVQRLAPHQKHLAQRIRELTSAATDAAHHPVVAPR